MHSASNPRTLLALTSVPRRFETSLRETVESLAGTREHVVVSIPEEYKKWGRAVPPPYLTSLPNVSVFRPAMDYGPATKLLGALEYLPTASSTYNHIITFDDDVRYNDPQRVIDYYKRHAARRPGCVITMGGIKLDHHPYHANNGLLYDNVGYVDVVAGYRGVLYPASIFDGDDRVFRMMREMPAGVFNEDDAYFGICLSRMNVPIYAVEQPHSDGDGDRADYHHLAEAGPSAVEEQTTKDRETNEMEIFQYAVARGWLPNKKASAMTPRIFRMLRRNRIAARFIRFLD
jgi:hypothetical protein